MKRKMLSMILTLAMILPMLPIVTVTARAAGPWEGAGAEGDPYKISSAEDLKALADAVNGGESYAGKYFKVTNNIDLSTVCGKGPNGGTNWTPIGDRNRSRSITFAGIFDGGSEEGCQITGLYINSNEHYQGLFGYMEGTVKNLTVDGEVTGYIYTGGVVGCSKGGIIENCCSAGTVASRASTEANGGNHVGGVVGWNDGGTVENCCNTSTVTIDGDTVGGVVGWNGHGAVINCYNTNSVEGRMSVGGVVGWNDGGTVENCHNTNTGNVTSKMSGDWASNGSYIGGVVGVNDGIVKKCYNTGSVTGMVYSIGGVVGENDGTVENCYNTGKVLLDGTTVSEPRSNWVGGVAGQNLNSTVKNCYNYGTVTYLIDNSDGTGLDDAHVGGVIGELYSGTAENCFYLSGTADGGIEMQDVPGQAEVIDGVKFADEGTFTSAGWDFDNIWTMCDSLRRPVLRPYSKEDPGEPEPTLYDIIIGKEIKNGAVTTDKVNSKAAAGELVTLTVKPADGYELKSGPAVTYKDGGEEKVVAVEKVVGSDNKYTFTMPASDVTVTASFKKIEEEKPAPDTSYTITVDDKIKNGSVTADKKTAAEKETVTLTVKPDTGYELVKDSLRVTRDDGVEGKIELIEGMNGTYSFTMPASDVTVTAAFKQSAVARYLIRTGASPAVGGSVSGGGYYDRGAPVILQAYPAAGYSFVCWTENGRTVSTSAVYTFTAAEDRTLTAVFSAIGGSSSGSSAPSGTANHRIIIPVVPNGSARVAFHTAEAGSTVIVIAMPSHGYVTASISVTDPSGRGVSIQDTGDDVYTFIMPASQVTVDLTFTAART